jgi:hypothetical protein
MAQSVRTFSRAHPSADASYASVLDRLEGTITQTEELAKSQEGGFATKHSSAVRRQDLRRRMRKGLLRHVATAAEDAGTEVPGIAERFPMPNPSATNAAFRAGASKLLEEGRAHQEVLVRHGLSADLLGELEGAIKEFDASLEETDGGKQSHVVARAEMKTLSDEISRLVGILDGFNRYRFHREPELIVAWESAKHVVSGPQVKNGSATPTSPVPSGLEPAA